MMRQAAFANVAVYVCVMVVCVAQREHIHLRNNGYEGLVVVIKPYCDGVFSTRMAQAMVDNIQTYLSETSRVLFTATKHRAYIRNVKVILPKDFPAVQGISIAQDTDIAYQRGNILVDQQSRQHHHRPYVLQPAGCGEPAQHLHITWHYLANAALAEQYGPVGKSLVHELGHLLWGLMEEYLEADSVPYTHPNSVTSTDVQACPTMLDGALTRDGRECREQEMCSFWPSEAQPRPNMATLMGYHFLDQVTEFCDNNASNPATQHNPRAHTQHNKRCQGFNPNSPDAPSAWEIMLQHADFAGGNNPPASPATDTQPTFTFIQSANEVLVLVLDVSGSMAGNDKIRKQRRAAEYLIDSAIEGCHSIGIVTFSSTATIASNLTVVRDEATRVILKSALPSSAGGGTCIGCGLNQALQMVPTGAAVIVLTDGEDSCPDVLDTAINRTLEANVVVDLVLYDAVDGTHQLVTLSRATGGSVVHAAADDDVMLLLNRKFLYLIQKRTCNDNKYTSTMLNERYNIPSTGTIEGEFFVDDTLNGVIQFYFSSNVSLDNHTSIQVYPPHSTSPIAQSLFSSQSEGHIITLTTSIWDRTGDWRFTITNEGTDEASYEALITASGMTRSCSSQPLTITPIAHTTFDFSEVVNYPQLYIRVLVSRGSSPAVGLSVCAVITSDVLQEAVVYALTDDGDGDVDSVADDGIYSARFTHFKGNHMYYIQYKVSGQEKMRRTSGEGGVADLPYLKGEPDPGPRLPTDNSTDPEWRPQNITRSQEGGFIQVLNQLPGTEHLDWSPPSRVTDLRIVRPDDVTAGGSGDAGDEELYLQFTAVGEDYNTGAASAYDIRVTNTSREALLFNFTSQSPLADMGLANTSDVTVLGGHTAGEILRAPFTIHEQYYGETLYYGVQAKDSSNNAGRVSNIVEYEYHPRDTHRQQNTSTASSVTSSTTGSNGLTTTTTHSKKTNAEHYQYANISTAGLLLVVAVGSVIAVTAVCAMIAYMISRSHRYLVAKQAAQSAAVVPNTNSYTMQHVLAKV